jgi:pyridoxamine 5'-phosphate oxidase family protein
MTSPEIFTTAELEFIGGQRLGRLATVDRGGAPQNNPVGVRYNSGTGTIDIGGFNMGATRKYRNVRTNPEVALVIDELASVDPWTVRGIEIRGRAEALDRQAPAMPGMSGEVIRVHPRRVISWGINPDQQGMQARTVADVRAETTGRVA